MSGPHYAPTNFLSGLDVDVTYFYLKIRNNIGAGCTDLNNPVCRPFIHVVGDPGFAALRDAVLAHPASVDSITTSGNKEDYVSMGMTAAIKLKKIVENTRHVLAIEAIAAAQALDFLAPLKPGKRAQQAVAAIRAASPRVEHDRSLAADFTKVAEVIARGEIAGVLK